MTRTPPTEEPLDLDTWPRREHFQFYRAMAHPHWSVTAPVDVSALTEARRAGRVGSFFLASLYLAVRAANQVEAFRLRLRGERVVRLSRIEGGSTVLRDDDTFAFAYFPHAERYADFEARGREVIEAVRAAPPGLDPRHDRDDLIYFSVLPWVAFTHFHHARHHDPDDAVPRIVFGRRHTDADGRRVLPVSVEVHHALVDGLHVGRFFERFQALLDAPDEALSG